MELQTSTASMKDTCVADVCNMLRRFVHLPLQNVFENLLFLRRWSGLTIPQHPLRIMKLLESS